MHRKAQCLAVRRMAGMRQSLATKMPQRAAASVAEEQNGIKRARRENEHEMQVESILLEHSFAAAGGKVIRSSSEAWQHFWKEPKEVVAIDCEGTHLSPPLLIQIALDENEVMLDVPDNNLSNDFVRLLEDETITKVFFGSPQSENLQQRMRNCVDLQRLVVERYFLERTKVPSLAKAATLSLVGGPFVKNRRLRKEFTHMRFARRPAHSNWLTDSLQNYSAADAWFALRIYNSIVNPAPSHTMDLGEENVEEHLCSRSIQRMLSLSSLPLVRS